jgi:hypothetical protein
MQYLSIPSLVERVFGWARKGLKALKNWSAKRYQGRYSKGMEILSANRGLVGEALLGFYRQTGNRESGVRSLRYTYPNGRQLDLPLVTRNSFVPQGPQPLQLTWSYSGEDRVHQLDPKTLDIAKARWESAGLQIWGGPIFSLDSVRERGQAFDLMFSTVDFFTYRATYGEVFDELGLTMARRGLSTTVEDLRQKRTRRFPTRECYLPDLSSILATERRICAGGFIVLLAARTPDEDLALVVQRRSVTVSDEPGALTPVPRAFHGPETDPSVEYDMSIVVYREIWEELFGGEDRPTNAISPLHFLDKCPAVNELFEGRGSNHVLAPTGLMWDLYRGNFIVCYCLHVTDPAWWARYSRQMELNWEFDNIRKNTPVFAGRGGITALLHSREWALDSYFSFIEGVRWLASREDHISRLAQEIPKLNLVPL